MTQNPLGEYRTDVHHTQKHDNNQTASQHNNTFTLIYDFLSPMNYME